MQNISAIPKNSFCDAPKIAVEHSGWQPQQRNKLHEAISSASILEKLKDKPTQINAVSCSSAERDTKGSYQLHLRSMTSTEQKKINISSPSSSISWNSDDSVGNNNKISSQYSPDRGGTLRIHEDYSGYVRQLPIRANKTESLQNHSKSTSEGATERTSNYSMARLEQIDQEQKITKQAYKQVQTTEGCNITKQRTNGLRQGTKTTEKNEQDQQFAEKENRRELLLEPQKYQMLLGNAQESLKNNGKITGKTMESIENELKENKELLNEQKQWISHWKMKAAGLESKEKENKIRFKEIEGILRFTEMQLGEAQQQIKYQDERIKGAENKLNNVNMQLEDIKIQAEEADRKCQAAERQATEAIQLANKKEEFAKEAIKNAQQSENFMQIALQKLHEAENKVQETAKQIKQVIERSEQAEMQLNEAANRVKIVEGMRDEFRQKVIDAQNQVEEYNNLTIQYQNKILHLESQSKQLQEDNIIARQQSENYYLELQDTRQSWKQRESEMNQGNLVLKEQQRNLKEVLEQTERELRLLRVDYDEMKEEFMKKLSESESKLATNSLELERVTNKNKEYLRTIDSLTSNSLTVAKTHQFKIQHIEDQHKAMLEIAVEREGKAKRQEYETRIFYLDSQLKLLTKELTFWREKYASEEQQQESSYQLS